MPSYESREQLISKIEWEGDIYETLSYGIKASDLPEDDTELVTAWQEAEDAFHAFAEAEHKVSVLLDFE